MKILSVLSIAMFLSVALAAAPLAAAKPDVPTIPKPDCMPVYREYDFGAVRVVSRDSCTYEVYVDGVDPTSSPAAADKCVLVIYIADYQWTYLCVDAADASCLVSVKQVSGVTERTTCYGVPVAPADAGTCVPVSGGMDYHSYVCADPKDAGCLVSTETSSDAGSETRCYGVLSPACLDMYWDADVGPVRVESRNSCHRQVYVFGQPLF